MDASGNLWSVRKGRPRSGAAVLVEDLQQGSADRMKFELAVNDCRRGTTLPSVLE